MLTAAENQNRMPRVAPPPVWAPEFVDPNAPMYIRPMESPPWEAGTRNQLTGLCTTANVAPPQPGFDALVDVGTMLGSLERYLSQQSPLSDNNKRRDQFFPGDGIVPKEFKPKEAWMAKGALQSPASTRSPTGSSVLSESPSGSESPHGSEGASTPPARGESPAPQFGWTAPFSLYQQPLPEQPQVPRQALEALHKLTDQVAEEHLKREDLMTNEVTSQLYPFIPYDEEGNVTSLGSILHAEGSCKPCVFWKKDRCRKKDLCLFCHFEHEIPKPACSRKSKSKRMRCARRSYEQEQSEAAIAPPPGLEHFV